jgi:hypothetical protein
VRRATSGSVGPDDDVLSSLAGGADRNRTDDICLAKAALCQLSYGPAPRADRGVAERTEPCCGVGSRPFRTRADRWRVERGGCGAHGSGSRGAPGGSCRRGGPPRHRGRGRHGPASRRQRLRCGGRGRLRRRGGRARPLQPRWRRVPARPDPRRRGGPVRLLRRHPWAWAAAGRRAAHGAGDPPLRRSRPGLPRRPRLGGRAGLPRRLPARPRPARPSRARAGRRTGRPARPRRGRARGGAGGRGAPRGPHPHADRRRTSPVPPRRGAADGRRGRDRPELGELLEAIGAGSDHGLRRPGGRRPHRGGGAGRGGSAHRGGPRGLPGARARAAPRPLPGRLAGHQPAPVVRRDPHRPGARQPRGGTAGPAGGHPGGARAPGRRRWPR